MEQRTITLSGSTDVRVENDLRLDSDSSVISMGKQDDVTFTHDGTTGLTIAANPFEVDSGGNITLDSHTGIFIFQDANSEVLRFTEGNSGDVTVKLETNGKDLIFTDNGDAEGFRILDAAAPALKFPARSEPQGLLLLMVMTQLLSLMAVVLLLVKLLNLSMTKLLRLVVILMMSQ